MDNLRKRKRADKQRQFIRWLLNTRMKYKRRSYQVLRASDYFRNEYPCDGAGGGGGYPTEGVIVCG